jgi:hypothetical protein
MAQVSSARRRGFRLGWWGAAAAHVGGKLVRRSRRLNALASAVQVTLHSFARVGRLLWLEVTGLFFLAFAMIGGLAAWHDYSRHKIFSSRLGAAICFMLIFGWFGLSSFYRAQRKAAPKSAPHVAKNHDHSFPR